MDDWPARIRIDRSHTATPGGFREEELAYLHFTLDHKGIPFLDDLGGGWVTGEGPGWVLHYRWDPSDTEAEEAFFPGIALTDEEAAVSVAREFLARLDLRDEGPAGPQFSD